MRSRASDGRHVAGVGQGVLGERTIVERRVSTVIELGRVENGVEKGCQGRGGRLAEGVVKVVRVGKGMGRVCL